MNNAKLWLVVKPTVGVPLFLSAVAIGSFAVHLAVVLNTDFVDAFIAGQPMADASVNGLASNDGVNAKVVFDEAPAGAASEATVVLPDGRTATVVFDAPSKTAMIAPAAQ